MKKESRGTIVSIIVIFVMLSVALVSVIAVAAVEESKKPKCQHIDCNNVQALESLYCSKHYYMEEETTNYENDVYEESDEIETDYDGEDEYVENETAVTETPTRPVYSNSHNTFNSSLDSYDEGYEDVYLDDDYDDDRYRTDSEYANGVDDAMEDEDW